MMFWVSLLIWAVTTVAVELIRPKPNFEDARPASLGDFDFPTATEGRAVPIIWGRVKIKGPNLVWYGGFRKEARTENVSTGMFSSEDVIIGYRYNVGMQFALCHGHVTQLTKVWVNDKSIAAGVAHEGSLPINQPNLFGGEEHGQGGLVGTLRFYGGTQTQATNSYLSAFQSPLPGYRGICYAAWEGGWVGNSPNIAPWAFEIERYDDGLNLTAYDPGSQIVNTYDMNPMNTMYEILTNTDWGLSISPGDIDVPNFQAAGSTLADEGNGWAMVLDGAMEVTDLIDEVQRQIDGSLFFNRAVAKWQVKLARDDYDPGTLDTYDETNIVELKDFTRQTWEETTNQVRVQFRERSDNYKATFALAQDSANMDIQGQTINADVSYPGVKDKTLANKIAWRDLRVLSYPMAKISFTVNRSAFNLSPGAVFKFSWDRLGISGVVFRVGKINYGKLGGSQIEIFAFQDIFAAGVGVYGDPTGSGWTDPSTDPVAVTSANTLILEAPRQMVVQDPYDPGRDPRMWMGARFPGGGTITLQSYNKAGTSRPIGGSYVSDAGVSAFVLVGTLDTDLAAYYGTGPARPNSDHDIDVDVLDSLNAIASDGTGTLVSSLANIAYINGEYIGFEKAYDLGGGTWRLQRIWRGLFHTAPLKHTSGDRVWFIGQGGNLTRRSLPSDYDEIDIQLRSVGAGEETTEGGTPVEEESIARIWRNPLAPRDPYLNGSYTPSSEDIDTLYTTETGRTGDDARALEVEVMPRDWRVDNVILDATLGADWLDDDPVFDFELILDPGGKADAVGLYRIDSTTTPTAYILRNDVIIALGANTVIPSDARVRVISRHTPVSTEYTCTTDMLFDFTLTTALQSADDLTHGGFRNVASTAVIYGETGNYTFDIHTALPSSGRLESSVNGAGFTTLVAAAATTGILAITASDSVRLRWATSGPAADQYFDVTGPTAELGYGVLEV